jgi:glycosyltransferase involved in cell wall biosynthesis
VIIGSLEIGGAERHLAQVLPRLDRELVTPEVFCLSHRGPLADPLERDGVPVTTPALYGPRSRHLLARVLSLCIRMWCLLWYVATHRPHIVHTFLPASYLLGIPCAILARVPIRIMSRRSLNHYQRKRPALARFERALHRHLSAAVGNSAAVVRELGNEGIDPRRLCLIHNGVEPVTRPDEETRRRTRQSMSVGDSTLVIVYVANLIPYKGHADLLSALATVRFEGDWTLWCVGRDDGPGASLARQAIELGLDSHARWLGMRHDVPDLLLAADLAVSSSLEEGFSNAVLEAMAAGLPVVATDVGGNAEAVVDSVTGYLVPPGDADAMANMIGRLAADPQERRTLGATGRTRAEVEFSVDGCVTRYEALYRGLLAGVIPESIRWCEEG